ncbi:MAG: hypothetical protein J6P03_05625 [Opitutales bacterium]|nr:hypothetical protein [Opitutales bacterium]
MSEEIKEPATSLPKCDLPKTAAPQIKIPAAAPAFAKRPDDFAAPAAEKKQSAGLLVLDAVCAVVAVAFAVMLFLEMK